MQVKTLHRLVPVPTHNADEPSRKRKTVSTAKVPVAQPAPAATVKTTDDRSTNQSTANTPPSFGRDSAFGVRPKGKREIEPRPQRMLCLKATTHV